MKRFFSALLAVMMIVSVCTFVVSAEGESANIEVSTLQELIDALAVTENTKDIVLTNDITVNAGLDVSFNGTNVIVKQNSTTIATIGTDGTIVSGSLSALTKWVPVKNLNGHKLDGKGYTISGLYIEGSAFANELAKGEQISDITFKGFTYNKAAEAATAGDAAIAVSKCYGSLYNVTTYGVVINARQDANYSCAAGIAARLWSTAEVQNEIYCPQIWNCHNYATVIGRANANKYIIAGGIVGQTHGGNIMNCYNDGDVYCLGGKSYGVGGIFALVEYGGEGALTDANSYLTHKVYSISIQNCANNGKITTDEETPFATAGVVGYIDATWMSGGIFRLLNCVNSGLVAKGRAIVGKCGNVNKFGKYDDIEVNYIINTNAASVPEDKGIYVLADKFVKYISIARTMTEEDALDALNYKAGEYFFYKGWEVSEGKFYPVLDSAPEVEEAPKAILVPDYDPATEVAALSAKVIAADTIQIKFSEAVQIVANPWTSIRYCTIGANGVPSLKGTANECTTLNGEVLTVGKPMQIGASKISVDENDATCINVQINGVNLTDALNGKYFGTEGEGCVVAIAIEGLTCGSNLVGYVDNIASADGTKLLKVTDGKQNGNGIHDGIYLEVENYNTDGLFDIPDYDPETEVALLSAELVAPKQLKVTFSEPVTMKGSSWGSFRYFTVNKNGSLGGFLKYDNGTKMTECQLGQTVTKLTNEDGSASYILTFKEDLLSVFDGTQFGTLEDEFKIYWSFEGLPVYVDSAAEEKVIDTNYTTKGYVDNITSLDGTKLLKATPNKKDTSKGIYDGAYVEVTAHTHTWTTCKDETQHWTGCKVCGSVQPGTDKTNHSFTLEVVHSDTLASEATCQKKATYYYSCECGALGDQTFEYGNFADHDYAEAWSKDETNHWHECTVCGNRKDEAAHTMEGNECSVCNYVPYTVGDVNGNETVDADDAIYLLYNVFFPTDYPVSQPCDFNNDSTVNADDAIYLLYHVFFPTDYPLFPED